MAYHEARGIIDSKRRILEEILGKTAFKDSLRHFLNNLDPENSPQLVRTIMSRDVEVPLALAAVVPVLANAVILGLDEAITQVKDKFPPALLNDFVQSLLEDIDRESLAHLMAGVKELSEQLSPVFRAAWDAADEQGKEED
ncbi:MAG TPA: hypothetical protein PLM29_02685 [Deltaproteobacteria bacterium]|nr:hypothetical protein [Deltaproteobacteria bacterium]